MKIGTLADWFGVGVIEGIRLSERCGAQGVQIYAWNELDPRTVTKEIIDTVKKTVRECNQEVTALCGELHGHGFEIEAENATKIEYLKKTIDLALDFHCTIVTTHIGRIPKDTASSRYQVMLDACLEVGEYAKKMGARVAVETGPEPVERLVAFCKQCPGIAINYDPANLVMVTKDDEVKGVATAKDFIVHTHAKDGIMKQYLGTEEVYEAFANGGVEEITKMSDYFQEMPLGGGQVRFKEYLMALKEIGYNGFLTIEREVKENAAKDIEMAVGFLKNLLKEI